MLGLLATILADVEAIAISIPEPAEVLGLGIILAAVAIGVWLLVSIWRSGKR